MEKQLSSHSQLGLIPKVKRSKTSKRNKKILARKLIQIRSLVMESDDEKIPEDQESSSTQ